MEQESVVDGNLATEASLIVLDTLEVIVKVKIKEKCKGFLFLFYLLSSLPSVFCISFLP